jgi:hypothetical protein
MPVVNRHCNAADKNTRTPQEDVEITMRFWYFSCLSLLFCATFCRAQEIAIRVINVANGRPLQKQAVSVSFLYDKRYDKEIPAKFDAVLNLETDAKGEAHFNFPEPPPVHFAAQSSVDWSHWKCGCGVMGSVNDLIQKGIVGPVMDTDSEKHGAFLKPVPRQILFAFHPLSLLERLLYPFTSE